MELQTRQMTFDEMYFKKPIILHSPAACSPNPVNNILLESGGQLPKTTPIPIQVDLSEQVFPSPSLWEKAGKSLDKNWHWWVLGTGFVAVVGKVLYNEWQKRKKKNSEQVNPNSQPQQSISNGQSQQAYANDQPQ